MTKDEYERSMFYSKSLGEKNFMATNQALKLMREDNDLLKQDNMKLKQGMANLMQQNQELMQKVNILFAKSIGNGATA